VASGVDPGDRVGLWAFNCAEWVIALLGISMAGSILVPINTRFKGREAADLLGRTGATALVTVTDFLDTDYVAMLRASEVPLPELQTIIVARGDAPDGTEPWATFRQRAHRRIPGRGGPTLAAAGSG
jgi:acyl-CoA synthetase (AMP-forming)/AMP-acid ligase II